MAIEKQQEHKETDSRLGLIEEFVNRKVPADWLKYSIDQRKMYWGSMATQENDNELVERDRISAVEVLVECFHYDKGKIRQAETREINNMLKSILPEWSQKDSIECGPYHRQRGFKKCF